MKYIELSQGKLAKVDVDLYNKLSNLKWYFDGYYVARNQYLGNGKSKIVRMHRFVYEMTNGEIPKGMTVDHINCNKLDNRIDNLRLCTQAENSRNKVAQSNSATGYSGITWHKRDKKYQAQIKLNGKWYYIGGFKALDEAIMARKATEKKYFGEFAHS